MTTSPEHPARVHGRAIALVTHYRNGDPEALAALLDELSGPESAGATICSLVQWCCRLLDERPENPDQWLQAAALHLAQQE
ncbi:MAG: hypothetical protein ACRDTH_29250 [Pseudonocardiaceae bacterium]